MRPPRPEEEAARSIAEQHLDRAVVLHDDGSVDRMYDLRSGPVEAPDLAIEVTLAVDPRSMKTWAAGQDRAQQWRAPAGDWTLILGRAPSLRRIETELPAIFAELSHRHLEEIGKYKGFGPHRDLCQFVHCLGIADLFCVRRPGRGKIYVTTEGWGGFVDSTGASVPTWISGFLRQPKRATKLKKLALSGARQREMFVPVTSDGAPWSVVGYLNDICRPTFVLPQEPPSLPDPLTGVWIVSTLRFGDAVGVRWDGTAWSGFDAHVSKETAPAA